MSLQVQYTNDLSIVSKHSMVRHGYFEDPYLEYFVEKQKRRAPIIHLGYYVRAVVIDGALLKFVEMVKNEPYQILSLGAGFDTSFFRLSGIPESKNLAYFEIDLDGVVKRKMSIINSNKILLSKLKNIKSKSENHLWSENYCLFAVDLRNTSEVEEALLKYNFDSKKPTLLLAECSIVYMDKRSSGKLKEFFGQFLDNAVFVSYEQILNYGAFGNIMINHFLSINSPLLSCECIDNQRKSFMDWDLCNILNSWEAFIDMTTEEERNVIINLEPFDEWEEWNLTCNHYALIIATKGSLNIFGPFKKFPVLNYSLHYIASEKISYFKNTKMHVYAHSSVLFNYKGDKYMVNIGGFGELNGSHKRMKNLTCFKVDLSSKFSEIDCKSSASTSFDFMHHTCTALNESIALQDNQFLEFPKFIIYGGRTSPTNSVNSVPKLVHWKVENNVLSTFMTDLIKISNENASNLTKGQPEGRWRHSACIISPSYFIIFGGVSKNYKVFNDLWMIDLNKPCLQWELKKCCSSTPPARFAHSAAADGHAMYISGGMNDKLESLSDIWMYDGHEWIKFPVKNNLPRYGHTSHVFQYLNTKYLALIGGVSTYGSCEFGITIVDLTNLACSEYMLPSIGFELPKYYYMLFNHSSVYDEDEKCLIINGGGGNFFSFGTKFNDGYLIIPKNCFISK